MMPLPNLELQTLIDTILESKKDEVKMGPTLNFKV